MTRTVISGALVAGVVVGVAGLATALRARPEPERVDLAPVAHSDVARTVTVLGSVSPTGRAVVQTPVTARVSAVVVKAGDRVFEGQLLARLDQSSFRADVLRREIAVQRTALALTQTGPSAPDRPLKVLEAREAQMEWERAQATASFYVLRAPKSGEVVAVSVRPGELLAANAPAVVIAVPDSVAVDVEADEFEIAGIAVAQPAVVFVDAWSRRPLTGRVESSPTLRRPRAAGAPAMYGFSILLDERPPGLKWGFTARAEIETARARGALVAPVSAVISIDQRDYVIASDRWGRRRAVLVRPGLSDDHVVAIQGEITADDRVLVGDAVDLRELLTMLLAATRD